MANPREEIQHAETVRSMTTFRLADGRMICGAFTFVNDLDYFDDEDWYTGPVEVIEEVWTLTSTRRLKVGGPDRSYWGEPVDGDELLAQIDGDGVG